MPPVPDDEDTSSEAGETAGAAVPAVSSAATVGDEDAEQEVPLPPEPFLPAPPLTDEPPPRKRPVVPPLDLAKVARIIEGEPQGAAAAAAPPEMYTLTGGSSGSSSCSEGSEDGNRSRPLTPRVGASTEIVENTGTEFFTIGSEAGSATPNSKSSMARLWNRTSHGGAVDVSGKQHEDEAEMTMPGVSYPWTYGRLVFEQQRQDFFNLARCGPLEGRRRLFLAALVLFQIALLLFFVDVGGIGSTTVSASSGAFSLAEARILLAGFAAIAGVITCCYFAHLRGHGHGMDREAQAMLGPGVDEADLCSPPARAAAKPRTRNYRELLRAMKEANAREPRFAAESRRGEAEAALPLNPDLEAPNTDAAPARGPHARRAGASDARPRSWPGPDRRRYSQLGNEEEGSGIASGFAHRARGLFTSPARRADKARSVRVASGTGRAAADETAEGWA